MRQGQYRISENRSLGNDTFLIRLTGETNEIHGNGDFVNISVPGVFLRRPISVFDVEDGLFTLIYKVVGKGTLIMAEREVGGELDILTGLGTGYALQKAGKNPLIVGGGYGSASLYGLAKTLTVQGKSPSILIGLNSADDAFFSSAFMDLQAKGARVQIVTVDGSLGKKGLVTDFISLDHKENYSFMYACGPAAMLCAISAMTDMPGQFSLESRMGCGFGACMGCSVMTKSGPKRVCKEGPVFDKEEIVWI
ncbi:MAG: dihydroorotate dehydrogenase electron transfer subunit [Clostridia bacterium]|nr:dihydroorotate dehydrogenase electron transfer subunit [Clostridia bacterium]